MNKREHNINVRLTNKEKAMVEALSKNYGDISLSDVMRRCAQERYIKVFPVYVTQKGSMAGAGVPKEELTKEQICEMLGGKVIKKDAGYMCFEPNERKGLVVPLSLMGQVGQAGDYRIKSL